MLHRDVEAKSIDPEGVAIRMPQFGPNSNDEHINAILRGSMRMVAVMLRESAEHPQGNFTQHPDYVAARDEIIDGAALLQKRMREFDRRNR